MREHSAPWAPAIEISVMKDIWGAPVKSPLSFQSRRRSLQAISIDAEVANGEPGLPPRLGLEAQKSHYVLIKNATLISDISCLGAVSK